MAVRGKYYCSSLFSIVSQLKRLVVFFISGINLSAELVSFVKEKPVPRDHNFLSFNSACKYRSLHYGQTKGFCRKNKCVTVCSLSFSLTVSIIAFNSFHMNSEMSLLKLPLFQLFCSQKREFSVVEGRYANKLCSMTIFVFQLISMVWKAWEKKKKNSTLIGTTLTTSPQWYNIVYFSYKPAWFYFWFHPKKTP